MESENSDSSCESTGSETESSSLEQNHDGGFTLPSGFHVIPSLHRKIRKHGLLEMLQELPLVSLAEPAEHEKVILRTGNFMRKVYGIPDFKVLEGKTICEQVISYIIKNDFVLPELSVKDPRKTGFLEPRAARDLKQQVPQFQTGGFTDKEDSVILSRAKSLMEELCLNIEDVIYLTTQMAIFRGKGHLNICRTIFGAFLGRPMLQYRRPFEVFSRFANLLKLSKEFPEEARNRLSGRSGMKRAKNDEISKVNQPTAKEPVKMLQTKRVHVQKQKCHANDFDRSLIGKDLGFKLGDWNEDDYATVIRYFLVKFRCEVSKIKLTDLDIKELVKITSRSPRNLNTVWKKTIWPTIAMYEAGEQLTSNEWKIKILQTILNDETILDVTGIHWKKLVQSCKYHSKSSLRKLVESEVSFEDHEGADSMKDSIEMAINRLRSTPPDDNSLLKMIIKIYQDQKAVLEDEIRNEIPGPDESDIRPGFA